MPSQKSLQVAIGRILSQQQQKSKKSKKTHKKKPSRKISLSYGKKKQSSIVYNTRSKALPFSIKKDLKKALKKLSVKNSSNRKVIRIDLPQNPHIKRKGFKRGSKGKTFYIDFVAPSKKDNESNIKEYLEKVNSSNGENINSSNGGKINSMNGGNINSSNGGKINSLNGENINSMNGGNINSMNGENINSMNGGKINSLNGDEKDFFAEALEERPIKRDFFAEALAEKPIEKDITLAFGGSCNYLIQASQLKWDKIGKITEVKPYINKPGYFYAKYTPKDESNSQNVILKMRVFKPGENGSEIPKFGCAYAPAIREIDRNFRSEKIVNILNSMVIEINSDTNMSIEIISYNPPFEILTGKELRNDLEGAAVFNEFSRFWADPDIDLVVNPDKEFAYFREKEQIHVINPDSIRPFGA